MLVDEHRDSCMKCQRCGNEILHECNSGLFEEHDVRQEKKRADGEGKVGIDDFFARPELAGEELDSYRRTCARWNWKEKLRRQNTAIRAS